MNEAFKVKDLVRYSPLFARRLGNNNIVAKRGTVVAVPQRRGAAVTIKWPDGTHSQCLPDNIEKIEIPKENISGEPAMENTAEIQQGPDYTKAVLLGFAEGHYCPLDEASKAALEAAGLPYMIPGSDLAEANVTAGSYGCTLVVSAPKAETFATAWDLVHELAESLKEDVSVFDRTQWLAAYGPDHDAAIRVCGASAQFKEALGRSLDRIGMDLREQDGVLMASYKDAAFDRSRVYGQTVRIRSLVSGALFEAITGYDVTGFSQCRIEDTTSGPVFAARDAAGSIVKVPVSEAEAGLLVIGAKNPMVEQTACSFLYDEGCEEPVAVLGESVGALNETKFNVLCYESPKTIKGEKKGFATGILYLAPATASGKNVCPMASGLIARQYSSRLDNGASVSDLLSAAEDDLKTAQGTKKKGEMEEILKILRKAKETDASAETTKTWLNTIGCVGACLGIRSGKGILNKVQQARARKTQQIMDPETRPALMKDIVEDIKCLVRFAGRKGMTPTIRLNGTSDLAWADPKFHVEDADGKKKSVFEIFSDITFYDYTKDPKRMKSFLDGELPKNYHLTFSYSGYNWDQCDEFLQRGGNIAMAFRITKNEPKPLSVNGHRVIDGDETDLRGLDGKGVIVGLSAKGQTGKYVTSFIVSPTGSKFDIKWPKDSKYANMSSDEKAQGEKKAEDRYLGKVGLLNARQRFREIAFEKALANASWWKKHVAPHAKRLIADLKSGEYDRLQNYYPDIFPAAEAAFDHFIKEVDPGIAKELSGKVWNPDDKEYFTGRTVSHYRKLYQKQHEGLVEAVSDHSSKHSDVIKRDGKTFHFVEFLEDMNGNGRGPGFWATLWRDDKGEEIIYLGGGWMEYLRSDLRAEYGDKVIEGLKKNKNVFSGEPVAELKKAIAEDKINPVLYFLIKHFCGVDVSKMERTIDRGPDHQIIRILDGPDAGSVALYIPSKKTYSTTGSSQDSKTIDGVKFEIVKKAFGIGKRGKTKSGEPQFNVVALFDSHDEAMRELAKRNKDEGLDRASDDAYKYGIVVGTHGKVLDNIVFANGVTFNEAFYREYPDVDKNVKFDFICEAESMTPLRDLTPEELQTGEALRKDIEAILKKYKIRFGKDTGVMFYSNEEWRARKERYDNNSPLVMIFEGELYKIMNYASTKRDLAIYHEIEAAARKHGLYGEFGYAWSMGFYPIKPITVDKKNESIVFETLIGSQDFNRLPLLDQLAVQIASYARYMSWRPLGIKAKDIDFTLMFGLVPDKAVLVRDAVSKALEGIDANQGKFLATDKLYEEILQILLAPSAGSGTYVPKLTVQAEGPLTAERTVQTPQGEQVAKVGEYVVTGFNGNQWPVTAEELSAKYTKLDEAAKAPQPALFLMHVDSIDSFYMNYSDAKGRYSAKAETEGLLAEWKSAVSETLAKDGRVYVVHQGWNTEDGDENYGKAFHAFLPKSDNVKLIKFDEDTGSWDDFEKEITTLLKADGVTEVELGGIWYSDCGTTGCATEAKNILTKAGIKVKPRYELLGYEPDNEDEEQDEAMNIGVMIESAPPDPAIEKWIHDVKPDFQKRYGDDYEQVLYGAAWRRFNKKHKKS